MSKGDFYVEKSPEKESPDDNGTGGYGSCRRISELQWSESQ